MQIGVLVATPPRAAADFRLPFSSSLSLLPLPLPLPALRQCRTPSPPLTDRKERGRWEGMFYHLARRALGIGEAREGLPASLCQSPDSPRRTHTHIHRGTHASQPTKKPPLQSSTSKRQGGNDIVWLDQIRQREKAGAQSVPVCVLGRGNHLHCASAIVQKMSK